MVAVNLQDECESCVLWLDVVAILSCGIMMLCKPTSIAHHVLVSLNVLVMCVFYVMCRRHVSLQNIFKLVISGETYVYIVAIVDIDGFGLQNVQVAITGGHPRAQQKTIQHLMQRE